MENLDLIQKSQDTINISLANFQNEDQSWLRHVVSENEWAMTREALVFIHTLIKYFKPKNILEFGAGSSTLTIADAVKKSNLKTNLISLDHDPEFGNMAAEKFYQTTQENNNLISKMFICPLVARDFGGEMYPVYFVKKEELPTTPLDLIIIDGPPTILGGREGTLYQMLEFTRPGTLILIDDANRKEEQNAIKQWKKNLGGAIEISNLPGFSRGMTAIIIIFPVAKSDFFSHKLALVDQKLVSYIAPEKNVILIGDDWWCDKLETKYKLSHFTRIEGDFSGLPPDSEAAIDHLKSMLKNEAGYLVISHSALWWLDYYKEFAEYVMNHSTNEVSTEYFKTFTIQPLNP